MIIKGRLFTKIGTILVALVGVMLSLRAAQATHVVFLVKDILPGSSSSSPFNLTNVNGILFFGANDGTTGHELWKSNGTTAGTSLVKDIIPGSGTALEPGSHLTNVNGTLFFAAYDGTTGGELWKSDGTTVGTTLVRDINPGSETSILFTLGYGSLTNVNGTLFFAADDGTTGPELWKSNGTTAGTTLVKDIFPGSSSFTHPWPSGLTNVNGTLFFTADDGTTGRELWKSDGTAAGTILLKDIFPGSTSSEPVLLTNVNGTLFFTANDGTTGYELWKSNGTAAGTILVKDIFPGSSGAINPYGALPLTHVNGTLFFTADDGTTGPAVWKSDGTAAGTTLVKDINPASNFGWVPGGYTNLNGTVFFAADDGISGLELWKSNGTAAGTTLVKDINPGSSSSSPFNLTNVNGILFFGANDGTTGHELWKSNGTAAGTTLVIDINPGSGSSVPESLTDVNGTLFFMAYDGTTGSELWVVKIDPLLYLPIVLK